MSDLRHPRFDNPPRKRKSNAIPRKSATFHGDFTTPRYNASTVVHADSPTFQQQLPGVRPALPGFALPQEIRLSQGRTPRKSSTLSSQALSSGDGSHPDHRRRSDVAHMTPISLGSKNARKTSPNLQPFWQTADAEREATAKRATKQVGQQVWKPSVDSGSNSRQARTLFPEGRPKATIGINLRLIEDGKHGEDESQGEDMPPRRTTATRAARKLPVVLTSSDSESSVSSDGSSQDDEPNPSSSSGEDTPSSMRSQTRSPDLETSPRNLSTPASASIELRPLLDTLPSSSRRLPTAPRPWGIDFLSDTLASLRIQKMRCPFLRRNVQRGFLIRCKKNGIRCHPPDSAESVVLQIEIIHPSSGKTFKSRVNGWYCPLCDVHGRLRTKDMIHQHLRWDHEDFQVTWFPPDVSQQIPALWTLRLTFKPRVTDVHATLPAPQVANPPVHRVAAPPPPSIPPSASTRVHQEQLATAPMPLKKHRSTSPDVPRQHEPPPRSPSPPRLTFDNNPNYLPAASEYGGPTVWYSCRPGGPKVYDLLNTLPMDEFGILAWQIIDKEEEIFESDDVSDENKVMHCLWNRWIFLNRNEFIRDYYQGTISFVDKYWKMIRRAAGPSALRYWLLLLLANRFLTGSQVAAVLKHYKGLAMTATRNEPNNDSRLTPEIN